MGSCGHECVRSDLCLRDPSASIRVRIPRSSARFCSLRTWHSCLRRATQKTASGARVAAKSRAAYPSDGAGCVVPCACHPLLCALNAAPVAVARQHLPRLQAPVPDVARAQQSTSRTRDAPALFPDRVFFSTCRLSVWWKRSAPTCCEANARRRMPWNSCKSRP